MNFAIEQFLYSLVFYGVIVLIPFLLLCYAPLKSLEAYRSPLISSKKETIHELRSTINSFIVLFATLLFSGLLQENGILNLNRELPTWYYVISFPLIVLIHDAYFYWTHYLMHKSRFMYRFHKKHHLSSETTPLDVFAFHPVEAFIHFVFFVIYPMIIPTNLEILQFMFIWMLVCNSAGHLPYEFYPKFLYEYPVIKQFNAATHHLMHHKHYNSNFSIYYNWWDRWMGTNHKDYFVKYQEVKKATSVLLEKKAHPAGKALLR